MYNKIEDAKKISLQINQLKESITLLHKDQEALYADLQWGAAHFLAKLLFEAASPFSNLTTLNDLQKSYSKINSTQRTFDIEWLLTNNWIQIVDGFLYVSSAIKDSIRQLEKVREAEHELFFLLKAKNKFGDVNSFQKSDLEKFLIEYNQVNSTFVSIEKAKDAGFISISESTYTLNNIHYYIPLIEEKEKLNFICAVIKPCFSKFKITKKSLTKIFDYHKIYFPLTPTIDFLFGKGLLVRENKDIYLNFYSEGAQYWRSLSTEIGANLWELLKNNFKNSTTRELLRVWLYKLQYIETLNYAVERLSNDKDHILYECVNLLLVEDDLNDKANELNKVISSKRQSGFMWLWNKNHVHLPSLTAYEDLCSLYIGLLDIDEDSQDNLFYDQSNRWLLNCLIQIVVFFDTDYSEDRIGYSRIRNLIVAGFDRPYLLWTTCNYILKFKPEIIPYLCLDERTANLALHLLYKMEKPSSLGYRTFRNLKIETLNNLFKLFLSTIRDSTIMTNNDKAKSIFQCLSFSSEEKWISYQHNTSIDSMSKQKYFKRRFSTLIKVFQTIPKQGRIYIEGGSYVLPYYPEILKEILLQLKCYKHGKLYQNANAGFPLVNFELLTKIADLVNSKEYLNFENSISRIKEKELVEEFINQYTLIMQLTTISVTHYLVPTRVEVAFWKIYQTGLELIPWHEWLLYIEKYQLYDQFYNKFNFEIDTRNGEYDNTLNFTVAKIRNHINVLLLAHENIVELQIKGYSQEILYVNVISRIEQNVCDLVTRYCKSDIDNKTVDIFSASYERDIFGSTNVALLPSLAHTINLFERKKRGQIIKSILCSKDILKYLVLLEYISNESELAYVRSQIININIIDYLSASKFHSEVESVVTTLSKYVEFIEQAKQSLEYWGSIISRSDHRKEETLANIFYVKLMIAYHEEDENLILNEVPPQLSDFTKSHYQIDLITTRLFYLGLVKVKLNKPLEAYTIFDNLIRASDKIQPSIAVNRFHANIKIHIDNGVEKPESRVGLKNALDEWYSFEDNVPLPERDIILGWVNENIWHNKLVAYHELTDGEEFDKIFYSLGKIYQYKKGFVELRVKNLVSRTLYEQAGSFLSEVKKFHKFENSETPIFITTLEDELESKDNFVLLREYYSRILQKPPESLVQILPENLAPNATLDHFLLRQLCDSVNDMLDIVNAIENIKSEDKYSDIIILSMNAKLRNWYWKVGNARGGYSDSNKRNVGELDFVIYSATDDRMATCEALLLNGKNTYSVTNHTIKTFNYDHRRKLFFIIVYYLGKNFSTHWNDYLNKIIPNIKYDNNFPVYEYIEPLDFPFLNHSLRAVKAIHTQNLVVHHLFININYKLQSK
jgi:hypothetical protein